MVAENTQDASRTFPLSEGTSRAVSRFIAEELRRAGTFDKPRARDAEPNASVTVTAHADRIDVTVSRMPAAAPSDPSSFGDWLVARLHRDGLSQEAAARKLGVSLKTVNRWARGHTEPRLRELRRVRAVFGDPPL